MGLCEYDRVIECISHLQIISKFHLNVNADNLVKMFIIYNYLCTNFILVIYVAVCGLCTYIHTHLRGFNVL